jgi:hypothetical protein
VDQVDHDFILKNSLLDYYKKLGDQNATTFRSGVLSVNMFVLADYQLIANWLFFDFWIRFGSKRSNAELIRR